MLINKEVSRYFKITKILKITSLSFNDKYFKCQHASSSEVKKETKAHACAIVSISSRISIDLSMLSRSLKKEKIDMFSLFLLICNEYCAKSLACDIRAKIKNRERKMFMREKYFTNIQVLKCSSTLAHIEKKNRVTK